MGRFLGVITPRICDDSVEIRLKALDSVHWLFAINSLHRGHGREYQDAMVESILEYREKLLPTDLEKQLIVLLDIAKIVHQRLSIFQLQYWMTALFELLNDRQSNSVASAAAFLLRQTLTDRGSQLQQEVRIHYLSITYSVFIYL